MYINLTRCFGQRETPQNILDLKSGLTIELDDESNKRMIGPYNELKDQYQQISLSEKAICSSLYYVQA